MDNGKMVKHWSHSHDLKLFEAEGKDRISCCLCEREISSRTEYAACEPCRVRIHKSCLDIPREIQHRCHPCLLSIRPAEFCRCNVCLAEDNHYHYGCTKCEFKMHIKCVLFSQEIVQGGDQAEHILHFSHHHPLQLFKDPKKDNSDRLRDSQLQCLACANPASGLVYGCKECDVYLHKPCRDILPRTISVGSGSLFLAVFKKATCRKCGKYFLFWTWCYISKIIKYNTDTLCAPCAMEEVLFIRISPSPILTQVHFHPCSLTLKFFPTFTCNACFANCHTHAYYCDQCDFYVGLMCAHISMESSATNKHWIRHFSHCHSLRASKDGKNISAASCKICGIRCFRGSYFCSKCDFHVHKSCLQILPQNVEHHHLFLTLVFLTTSSYICIVCGQQNSSGLTFRSIETGFKLCMECALWPKNKSNDNGTFTSIHHWHPLLLVDTLERDANCLLCTRKISTVPYYCSQCKDYFHKTCAELPLEIHHPLHNQHPLSLISSPQLPESSRSCSLCQGDFLSVGAHPSSVYRCNEKGCSFQLDKKCATSFPSIQYEGHSHPLTVVESMQGQDVCRVCSASCVNNIVFRCAIAECKFSLHLSCGPLPCKIKHQCHVHPLILEDFHVEDNYTDKFACHFCEQQRNPKLPVYCCEEGCPMICEVECVISEVMPKLLWADGEVKLRTTFPNVRSKVIIRDESLMEMTPVSRPISQRHGISPLRYLFSPGFCTSEIVENWKDEMLYSHGPELEREEEDKGMFTFSKQTFEEFSSKLGCTHLTLDSDGIPNFISQHDGHSAGGEFMLPPSLIPIYRELTGKSSVLGETLNHCLTEDEEFYSSFVFIICAVIHNMRDTKLVDVTNERVLQWLTLLKLVEEAGVDISFLFDKIKLVWQAHFLIKAKAIVDNTSEHLRGEVGQISQEEEELERKLEETRRKKKEALEQLDRHYDYEKAGMKSLKKELKDVLFIKWKPASSVIQNLCERPGASNSRTEKEEEEDDDERRRRYLERARTERGRGRGRGRTEWGRGRGRGRTERGRRRAFNPRGRGRC